MDLEEQIAQMVNPQEFTKLCNTVFTAKYGADFQTIDGTRGDKGNDGYVSSEKRVLAMHCPVKPEQKTDKAYLSKIRKDLAKAVRLRKTNKFAIECWTFVTPRKLGVNVISEMQRLGKEEGLQVSHIESTYLADVLYRHRHLIAKFPFLHLSDIDEKVTLLLARFDENRAAFTRREQPSVRKGVAASEDLKKVLRIRSQDQTRCSKTELRSIFYQTDDPQAKLNVVSGLIQWADADDKEEDMVQWCDLGVAIAQTQHDRRSEAYFLANKGMFLSMQWSKTDMDMAFAIRIANKLGVVGPSPEARAAVTGRLKELERQFEDAFANSLRIATELTDSDLYADALLCIANAAGFRRLDYKAFDMESEANSEQALSKRAFLGVLHIHTSMGNERKRAYTMHNLANQLRCWGEVQEAISLNESVIEIATRLGEGRLLQTAEWLRETLITGRMPNYTDGERRPLKK